MVGLVPAIYVFDRIEHKNAGVFWPGISATGMSARLASPHPGLRFASAFSPNKGERSESAHFTRARGGSGRAVPFSLDRSHGFAKLVQDCEWTRRISVGQV